MNRFPKLLEIGKIVKTHGLKGYFKVASFLDSGEVLETLKDVCIKGERDLPVNYTVESVQIARQSFFIKLEGIDSIEAALPLIGYLVMIDSSELGALAEDEYYWKDILGLDVVTEEGLRVGRVEEIFPTGSNDVYVVRGGQRELLLPAIGDVVKEIDIAKGKMVVRLLEGL
ncbi:MAG: ribosome maturation factor RimM [Smithellaceae bacterium]|nr:ribosome maturation factor RimM [Smithellaceae bacterium]